MSRRDRLLSLAAAALADMRDPLDGSFLREHVVTADECFDLADDLELGARMVLRTRRDLASGGLAATVAVNRIAEGLLDSAVEAKP